VGRVAVHRQRTEEVGAAVPIAGGVLPVEVPVPDRPPMPCLGEGFKRPPPGPEQWTGNERCQGLHPVGDAGTAHFPQAAGKPWQTWLVFKCTPAVVCCLDDPGDLPDVVRTTPTASGSPAHK